jgi:hypothetical protein
MEAAAVGPPPLAVRHYPRWNLRFTESSHGGRLEFAVLMGDGEPELRPFDAASVEDVVAWLDDADWLDELSEGRVPPPGLDVVEQLRGLLIRVGDLGCPAFLTIKTRPGIQLLPLLIAELSRLRLAWRMAEAIHRADHRALAALRIQRQALRALRGEASPHLVTLPELVKDAQEWAAGQVLSYGLAVSLNVERPLGPYRATAAPDTPLGTVMLATAIGLGAIEHSGPGVYACDYRPCGRIFVGSRTGVRGEHVFCSPRCGKRFHSTQNTYAKRAWQRSIRESVDEQ